MKDTEQMILANTIVLFQAFLFIVYYLFNYYFKILLLFKNYWRKKKTVTDESVKNSYILRCKQKELKN